MVIEVLEQVRAVNEYRKAFNPLESNQEFTLSMTDISHLNLLPTLLQYLRVHAPSVRLNVVPIGGQTAAMMSSGDIDLAIGFIPQLEAGFYQQTLFKQQYVALIREDHPRISGETLTLDAYLHELHVDVIANGTGHYIIETEMHKQGINREVVIKLPSYLGVGLVIQETELIATVPERLSKLLLSRGNLKMLDLPFTLPTYSVKQHWHERMHGNPANQWLRQTCFHLFHF